MTRSEIRHSPFAIRHSRRGRLAIAVAVVALGLLAAGRWRGAAADTGKAVVATPEAQVRLSLATPVKTVDERFLSVAIDSSQIVGGHWWTAGGGATAGVGSAVVPPFDFTRPRLLRMARELAPAYLRLGGSEADKLFYDLSDSPGAAPPKFDYVLTRAMWDPIGRFALDAGYDLFFTLNAGPGPRGARKVWRPDNARDLIAYTTAHGYPVRIWELGNEINAYPIIFKRFFFVRAKRYAADMATLRALVGELDPHAAIAGPSSAFWPILGEMLMPILPNFLEARIGRPDIVTWHYYPQESRRCPIAIRRAGLETMLSAPRLDDAKHWSDHVLALRDKYAPRSDVALGETGNAQCGGEPGVSDRFVAGLWWLDELGLMARAGQKFVVRQTLSGSEYGLIDDATLAPNPDYWNSLLWKRLMGPRVLAVATEAGPHARRQAASPTPRVYAHCTPGRPGAAAALLLNIDPARALVFRFPDFAGQRAEVYRLTAPDLASKTILLNGAALATGDDGAPPALTPAAGDGTGSFPIAPASYAFVVFPEANAAACR